jgi:hypothetical protein
VNVLVGPDAGVGANLDSPGGLAKPRHPGGRGNHEGAAGCGFRHSTSWRFNDAWRATIGARAFRRGFPRHAGDQSVGSPQVRALRRICFFAEPGGAPGLLRQKPSAPSRLWGEVKNGSGPGSANLNRVR